MTTLKFWDFTSKPFNQKCKISARFQKDMFLPVKGIGHLNGDQHRQGHGHGRSSLEHLTVNSSKVLVFIMALHEVRLDNKGKGLNSRRRLAWLGFSVQIRKIKQTHQGSEDKDSPADGRSLLGPLHHIGTSRQQHQQWQHQHILKVKRNSFLNDARTQTTN